MEMHKVLHPKHNRRISVNLSTKFFETEDRLNQIITIAKESEKYKLHDALVYGILEDLENFCGYYMVTDYLKIAKMYPRRL